MDEQAAKPKDVKKDDPSASGVVSAGQVGKGIAAGVILDGKYLVCRLAGTGAFGLVYEAQNIELDEKVAIKCLRPEILVDAAMVARFAREAKAAAAIKSEYVATVYDVGTHDGVPYIVMEYLEGKELGTVLQENGRLGPRTAVEFALQVCEALAVAHSKGIVHRDIKPENLLLTERAGGMRILKVLDFGISKAALTGSVFRDDLPIVKTVNMMGTPLYMSPEQVRSSTTVDVRSDIWSLGMVLYEVLTGETAFAGESITEICAAILETEPLPIELLRNDLPPGLAAVVRRCLEKDLRKRFQNVAELALALMPFGPKRTRLNVERTVTALQGAGMFDAAVQVISSHPPASAETLNSAPIPPPPRLGSAPELAALPIASVELVPGSGPSLVSPRATSEATPSAPSAEARRRPSAPSELEATPTFTAEAVTAVSARRRALLEGADGSERVSVRPPVPSAPESDPPPRQSKGRVLALVVLAAGLVGIGVAAGPALRRATTPAPAATAAPAAKESTAAPTTATPAAPAPADPAPAVASSRGAYPPDPTASVVATPAVRVPTREPAPAAAPVRTAGAGVNRHAAIPAPQAKAVPPSASPPPKASAPPPPPSETTKPAEAPTGRTFRRDL